MIYVIDKLIKLTDKNDPCNYFDYRIFSTELSKTEAEEIVNQDFCKHKTEEVENDKWKINCAVVEIDTSCGSKMIKVRDGARVFSVNSSLGLIEELILNV